MVALLALDCQKPMSATPIHALFIASTNTMLGVFARRLVEAVLRFAL
jgi:hypothetical protein